MKAKNVTPNDAELMESGSIELVVRYIDPAKAKSDPDAKYALDDYSYIVGQESNNARSISRASQDSFEFALSAPVPLGAKKVDLFIVYKGTLGKEQDIAVAVGRKYVGDIGQIEISMPEVGPYAQSEYSDYSSIPNFTRIRMRAKNASSTIDLKEGSLELVIMHRVADGDQYQDLVSTIEDNFNKIIVSPTTGVSSLAVGATVDLEFDLSSTPLPSAATDLYFVLRFRGNNASAPVTGLGYKDVSEPTPIMVLNLGDYVCLNNAWYATGSAEAIAQADLDNDGYPEKYDVFSHTFTDMYFRISSGSNPQPSIKSDKEFYIAKIAPGESFKALVVTDETFAMASSGFLPVPDDSRDNWKHNRQASIVSGSKTAFKNQLIDSTSCINCPPPIPIYFYDRMQFQVGWARGFPWLGLYSITATPYPSGSKCNAQDIY